MNLTKGAQYLGVSSTTLRAAVDRGAIEAELPLPHGPWIFSRKALETEAARKLVVSRVQGNLYPHKTDSTGDERPLFNDIAR